jgi:hypothetical protein
VSARNRSNSFKAKYGQVVPRTIEQLPRRSLPELQSIWAKLVPHLVGRNEHEVSPLANQLRDAILHEWNLRAKDAASCPDQFEWPSIDAPCGDGRIETKAWRPEGMLAYLGYHVGVTNGVSAASRKAILDSVFLHPLPPLNGPVYMAEWGLPETGLRLQKLAECLAAFVRNGSRRRQPNCDVAIEEWTADLEYLYVQYYRGRFDFTWPLALQS